MRHLYCTNLTAVDTGFTAFACIGIYRSIIVGLRNKARQIVLGYESQSFTMTTAAIADENYRFGFLETPGETCRVVHEVFHILLPF